MSVVSESQVALRSVGEASGFERVVFVRELRHGESLRVALDRFSEVVVVSRPELESLVPLNFERFCTFGRRRLSVHDFLHSDQVGVVRVVWDGILPEERG